MDLKQSKERNREWACRILLGIHLYRVVGGMIAYWQTKYQLASPLIPPQTLTQISEPYFKASLIIAAVFLLALWFYFFQRRIVTLTLSALSILSYGLLVERFAQ